jgi:hypothetical protein
MAARSIHSEVAASRVAWPLLYDGLPHTLAAPLRLRTSTASAQAHRLASPPFVTQARAKTLTGPAAGIAGLYISFSVLAERAWTLLEGTIAQLARSRGVAPGHATPGGSRAAESATSGASLSANGASADSAEFLRANVGLYIHSVYDAHFNLGLLEKSLQKGYSRLGGPEAFGRALTQARVSALARAYSPGAVRLQPHPGPTVSG